MDRYYPQFEQGVISPFPMKKAAIEDERRLEWDPAHFAAFQARPQENRVRCDDCQNYMLNELCVRNGANGGAEYGEGHPRYAPNRSRITVTEHEPNEPYDVCDFVMTICPRCHRIESDLFLCGEHRTEANFMAACRLDWKLIGPAHPSPISAQEMDYTMKRHIYVDKVPDYCDHCRPSGE